MSENNHFSEEQLAEVRQYVSDMILGNDHIAGMLQRSHFKLIANESPLLASQLNTLVFQRVGEDVMISLPDYSLRSIIREAGLENGRRREGTRPAKFWLQLLCTAELCSPYEAEKAYHDVFNARIELNKLTDEDFEFATHPPDSFYRVRDVQPEKDYAPTHRVTVHKRRVHKPSDEKNQDYMRQTDVGGSPSKLALDTPANRIALEPNRQKIPEPYDARSIEPPIVVPAHNPDTGNHPLAEPGDDLELKASIPMQAKNAAIFEPRKSQRQVLEDNRLHGIGWSRHPQSQVVPPFDHSRGNAKRNRDNFTDDANPLLARTRRSRARNQASCRDDSVPLFDRSQTSTTNQERWREVFKIDDLFDPDPETKNRSPRETGRW